MDMVASLPTMKLDKLYENAFICEAILRLSFLPCFLTLYNLIIFFERLYNLNLIIGDCEVTILFPIIGYFFLHKIEKKEIQKLTLSLTSIKYFIFPAECTQIYASIDREYRD